MEAIDDMHEKIHGLQPAVSRVIATTRGEGGEIDAFT